MAKAVNMAVDMIKVAKAYRDIFGLSVIPITSFKTPFKNFDVIQYRDRFATDQEIESWWGEKFKSAGIACVCGKLSNRTVIDLDTYKNKNTENLVNSLVPDNFMTPISSTPRGGQHWHFNYDPRLNDVQIENDDCNIDVKSIGYAVMPPTQGRNGTSYKWVVHPKDTPLSSIPDTLFKYIDSNNSYKKGGVLGGGNNNGLSQNITNITDYHNYFTDGRRDNDLFHVANCMLKGGMPKEEIKYLLLLMATKLCNPPESDSKALAKVKSAIKRLETRERGIAQDVKEWVEVTEGHFGVTECHKDLELVTKSHKHSAMMALLRLVDEGILEKHGTKRGFYRRIEKDEIPIEWWKDEEDSINIEWVFGLNKYIHTMPKSVYVIAGDQDAGKSAICLNMAILNCGKFPIYYFSSEMAGQELGSRLKLSESYDLHKFKEKIKFIDRSRDFADVIKADAFNIIDYFEITENFYLIAKEMTRIRDKLNKGICLIALQKKKGQELGRGAEFSLEKPRLYLTIEHNYPEGNILKIVKAKNWRNPDVNPNNKYCKFKLFRGINLGPGAWEEDYE